MGGRFDKWMSGWMKREREEEIEEQVKGIERNGRKLMEKGMNKWMEERRERGKGG